MMDQGLIEAAGGTVHWVETPGQVRLRVAHWPRGSRGVVLLLNGRTEFIEKHLETVADLQARGFAVWTLDWRGQGLSSRHAPDPVAHYIERFDNYLSDLFAVIERLVQPSLERRPLLLMAHSMGGHLAARALARRPELFARAILCAPMIGVLRGGPMPDWLARLIVGLACLRPAIATRYGPGAGPPDHAAPFEGNRLTTCPQRYAADIALVTANPALAVGGVTWGWLRAAFASIHILREPAVIARIAMPVLVAIASDERIVDNRAARAFTLALPRGKLVVIEGARHELLREHNRYRQLLWAAIDPFLAPLD